MKEATGELNMTVITVVAIAAIAGVFYLWVWPSIQVAIAKNTCKASCENGGNCNTITISNVKSPNFDATSFCTGTGTGTTQTTNGTGGTN